MLLKWPSLGLPLYYLLGRLSVCHLFKIPPTYGEALGGACNFDLEIEGVKSGKRQQRREHEIQPKPGEWKGAGGQ